MIYFLKLKRVIFFQFQKYFLLSQLSVLNLSKPFLCWLLEDCKHCGFDCFELSNFLLRLLVSVTLWINGVFWEAVIRFGAASLTELNDMINLKGIVHTQMRILSLFIHPYVVPNLYAVFTSLFSIWLRVSNFEQDQMMENMEWGGRSVWKTCIKTWKSLFFLFPLVP